MKWENLARPNGREGRQTGLVELHALRRDDRLDTRTRCFLLHSLPFRLRLRLQLPSSFFVDNFHARTRSFLKPKSLSKCCGTLHVQCVSNWILSFWHIQNRIVMRINSLACHQFEANFQSVNRVWSGCICACLCDQNRVKAGLKQASGSTTCPSEINKLKRKSD